MRVSDGQLWDLRPEGVQEVSEGRVAFISDYHNYPLAPGVSLATTRAVLAAHEDDGYVYSKLELFRALDLAERHIEWNGVRTYCLREMWAATLDSLIPSELGLGTIRPLPCLSSPLKLNSSYAGAVLEKGSHAWTIQKLHTKGSVLFGPASSCCRASLNGSTVAAALGAVHNSCGACGSEPRDAARNFTPHTWRLSALVQDTGDWFERMGAAYFDLDPLEAFLYGSLVHSQASFLIEAMAKLKDERLASAAPTLSRELTSHAD